MDSFSKKKNIHILSEYCENLELKILLRSCIHMESSLFYENTKQRLEVVYIFFRLLLKSSLHGCTFCLN